MKTRIELRELEKAATTRENLASMRGAALNYRMALAPDNYRSLEQRGKSGVRALQLALSYRNMARNMGRWAKGES